MLEIIINGRIEALPQSALVLDNQADYFQNLLVSFGYNPDNPPLGDFLAQYHGLKGEWLVAEPVYWEATHNDALILGFGDALQLTAVEAKRFFQQVAKFFKEDKTATFYHDKYRWLIEKSNKTAINAKPTSTMLHQSLMPAFNAMDSSMYWQQLMTELQMFLSNNPLNDKRQGKLVVNGLWIFGEGTFRMPENKNFYTDDLNLLAHFPDLFQVFQPDTLLETNTCLVINKLETLPNNWPNIPSIWRWNNMAYQIKKRPVWNRLWRYLTHANKT